MTATDERPGDNQALVEAFAHEAGAALGAHYCRLRRGEFLLQRMLLPEVFGRRYARALDIGCGVGFKSLLLTDVAARVDGIDIDVPYHGFPIREPAATFGQCVLDRIGTRHVTLSTVTTYEAFLRTHTGTFDLIVSDYLVEHVEDVATLHAAVFGALQPGGVVLHVIPNSHEAIEQFVRLNSRSSLRDYAKAVLGTLRPGRRAPKLTMHGTMEPIPHSEFVTRFGEQFDVYRLEGTVLPMIEAGFHITRIVPTREHSYTVAARRPGES